MSRTTSILLLLAATSVGLPVAAQRASAPSLRALGRVTLGWPLARAERACVSAGGAWGHLRDLGYGESWTCSLVPGEFPLPGASLDLYARDGRVSRIEVSAEVADVAASVAILRARFLAPLGALEVGGGAPACAAESDPALELACRLRPSELDAGWSAFLTATDAREHVEIMAHADDQARLVSLTVGDEIERRALEAARAASAAAGAGDSLVLVPLP